MLIEWIFLASASFKKLARGMIFFLQNKSDFREGLKINVTGSIKVFKVYMA